MIVKLLILVSVTLIASGRPDAVKVFKTVGGLVGRAVGAYQGFAIRATQFSSSPEVKRFQQEYNEEIEGLAAGLKGMQELHSKFRDPKTLVRSSILADTFSSKDDDDDKKAKPKQQQADPTATSEQLLNEIGLKIPTPKVTPVLSIPIEVLKSNDGAKPERRVLEFYDLDIGTSNAYKRLYTSILECNFTNNPFGLLPSNPESSDTSTSSGESARFRKDYDRQSFDYTVMCLGAEAISKAILSSKQMRQDAQDLQRKEEGRLG